MKGRGKKLLDADPTSLDDSDLDMQIGAIAEELHHLNSEVNSIDNKRQQLLDRIAELTGRKGAADGENNERGRGRGRP